MRVNVGVSSENPAFAQGAPDPSVYPDLHVAFRLDLATYPLFPPGSAGPTFAGVGLVPSTYIDSLGYANIHIANYYDATAAPFGGSLNIFTDWNTLYNIRGARFYRVWYSKDGGPATQLLQTWTNFHFVSPNWVATAFGASDLGRYRVPRPGGGCLVPHQPPDQLADGPVRRRQLPPGPAALRRRGQPAPGAPRATSSRCS